MGHRILAKPVNLFVWFKKLGKTLSLGSEKLYIFRRQNEEMVLSGKEWRKIKKFTAKRTYSYTL